MPFGLSGAPGAMQSLMREILKDFEGKRVVIYLDDVLIHADTRERHYQTLLAVLASLEANSFHLEPPMLTTPLYVVTDASKLSETFTTAERHWHSIDREVFALVASLLRYPEIFGNGAEIHVLTDSKHFTRRTNMEKNTERRARWKDILGSHKLHFTHIPGAQNVVANALSRSVVENSKAREGKVIQAEQLAKNIFAITAETGVTPLGWT
ncbi:hypothetical protein Q9L58_009669, partial [Maublancomyces gigas]